MDLTPAPCPLLFPPWVSIAAVLGQRHHSQQFAAGRACAARALGRMDARLAQAEIVRGPGGEPLWPSGFTGSITHTADYVAAAVARVSDATSLGLDAQQIIEEDRAARVWPRIVMPDEAAVGTHLPLNVRFCLLFAVKEATFKCVYPLVGRRFYFDALHVRTLDLERGVFEAQLATTLSEAFTTGLRLTGRIAADPDRVYCGLYLPAASDRRGPADCGGQTQV